MYTDFSAGRGEVLNLTRCFLLDFSVIYTDAIKAKRPHAFSISPVRVSTLLYVDSIMEVHLLFYNGYSKARVSAC